MKAGLKVYMRHNVSKLKSYKYTKEKLGHIMRCMAQVRELLYKMCKGNDKNWIERT